jgi:hypothetical protein
MTFGQKPSRMKMTNVGIAFKILESDQNLPVG